VRLTSAALDALRPRFADCLCEACLKNEALKERSGSGGKYVLYDSSTKTVYELDDQKKPERFAGEKVTVTGNLDLASKTIHVANIKAAS
jgi:Protein of unknown function (DUF5818)